MGVVPTKDSYVLTSPQGSTYDLASWSDLSNDGGPDFGDSWLNANYTSNQAADGGQLNSESVGVRTMRFPMLVASSGAVAGIDLLENETQLRLAARPGATLDIEVAGDQSISPIRFDVLTGRWKPNYNVRHQSISVRLGTLELDTQPFGYMPTEIILASAASVGLPGVLSLDTSKLIGDVAGLAKVRVTPYGGGPTEYPSGTWRPDAAFWSLSGRASFLAHLRGGSLIGGVGMAAPTIIGDQFAPASQSLEVVPSAGAGWAQAAVYQVGPELEPAYRGRYRAFVWARLRPSQPPWFISLDMANSLYDHALASAAPIATILPDVASGTPGAYGAQASPAFRLLDLGEIAIPDIASGVASRGGQQNVRVWVSAPTTGPGGVATPYVRLGGIYLLPLDAGYLPRGLITPTIGDSATNADVRRLVVDGIGNRVFLANTIDAVVDDPVLEAAAYYRGPLPLVGASSLTIDVCGGARKLAASTSEPLIRSAPHRAAVSVSYRPRFAFVRGF
jgi:hypothetical protein